MNERTLTDADINAITNALMRKELRAFRILLKQLRPDLDISGLLAAALDRHARKEAETYDGNRFPETDSDADFLREILSEE